MQVFTEITTVTVFFFFFFFPPRPSWSQECRESGSILMRYSNESSYFICFDSATGGVTQF